MGPLDLAFNGQWSGTWTPSIGLADRTVDGVLAGTVTPDGKQVDLGSLCFYGGPGTVRATENASDSACWGEPSSALPPHLVSVDP